MTRTRTRGVVALAATAVVVALLAGCAPPLGRPAVGQRPNAARVWDNSDPAVFVWQGRTYLFGSTNNRKAPVREISSFHGTVEQSRQDWARSPRDAMPTRPAWVDPGEWDIWAPTVVRMSGRFVMYFASKHKDATTDESNDQCIGRADATSPMGPFTPWSTPVYCGLPPEGAGHGLPASNRFGRGALDPEVFQAPGGTFYLLVTMSRTNDNIGSLRLDSSGRPVGGRNARPSTLVSQAYEWHDGRVDGVRRGHTVLENPSMVRDPATDTYLLFYSAGRWYTGDYLTGFARCSSPTGPCAADGRGPFLQSGNGRSGPGGLTAFRDANGVLRAAYATWTAGREAQPSTGGDTSRRTHWAVISLSGGSDPARQSVSLR